MDNDLEPLKGIVKFIDTNDINTVDWELFVAMGIQASEIKTYSQWVLGKLADSVSVRYGDLKKYALEISQNYDVLRSYASTYRKYIKEDPTFTPERYCGSMPWGVLQLAATKSDAPQKLVDELHDKGINTISSAYREIKSRETGVQIPNKPKIDLYWDNATMKYKIKLNPQELDLIDWSDVKDQLKTYLETLK